MPCLSTNLSTAAAADELLSIALPVPLARTFDYLAPSVGVKAQRGMRVRVRFGQRLMVGMVVAVGQHADSEREYRPIEELLDGRAIAPAGWLETLQWAAEYYQHPIGEVIAAALPSWLRDGRSATPAQRTLLQITETGRQAIVTLPARAHRLRASLLNLVKDSASFIDSATRRRLLASAWVTELAASTPRRLHVEGPPLTAAQCVALKALRSAEGFTVHVLEGVTGSGKTELYLRLAEEALARGRQVLVLCPEIGLTPQLMGRFTARFGLVVAGFHSGLSDAERTRAWLAIRDGDARVLVGTRSAVFAPFQTLGLVIVDEEHDASFKQQEGFRYHARDLAVMRARSAEATVVLGSATPALETLANIKACRYRRVELTERISGLAPPIAQLVDLNVFPAPHGVSEPLAIAIDRHLTAGGQALLFINRRGYAPTLLCESCHWVAPCPHCDAKLNLHRGENVLRCHHCGHAARPPRECAACGSKRLLPVGEGAERVEEALKNRFPGRRIERFDTDRLRAAGKLDALLQDVHARRVDVLVGTQMLAKGHDFPALSLVGVVNADQALFSSDFRALERLGQLLTQVAGRAGRSAAGVAAEVLIQTREPRHPGLVALLRDGYAALAAALLQERALAGLPPSTHLALLRAEAVDRSRVEAFLNAARACFPNTSQVSLLGPAPAPMERRNGRLRAQLLLNAAKRPALQRALGLWLPMLETLPGARQVRWSIDVDPVDLF